MFSFCVLVNFEVIDYCKYRKGKNDMEQQISIQDDYLWIQMPVELDHRVAESIRKEADVQMMQEGVENVVFDFSKTEFMDSSGIGLIVGRYKKIQCLGGEVLVVHANKRIRKMFTMAGLRALVHIVEE